MTATPEQLDLRTGRWSLGKLLLRPLYHMSAAGDEGSRSVADGHAQAAETSTGAVRDLVAGGHSDTSTTIATAAIFEVDRLLVR